MEEESWRAVLGSYLRQYWKSGLLFFCFTGIFAAVFWLYGVLTEAVLYAAGLCLLAAAAVVTVHVVFYRKRHLEYCRISRALPYETGDLPEPVSLAERDLQEMTRRLSQLLEEAQTRWQAGQRESMDYYTTWVHQIKTPIAVMKMLLEREDTEEHRELLAELFRIEQYVEMVLTYLRLGSDTSDYVFQEYDLDGIIRQAIRKYAPQFIRRKIRLIYHPASVKVLTDEKWLLFIIEQVLSNSIKYTFEGSVSIEVTPEKVLKLADTGIGIAPEDLPRVFEKGFTGFNGRADKKSTGLGLYLCRTAAGRLSHRIWAESTPGAGTTIFIDLSRPE